MHTYQKASSVVSSVWRVERDPVSTQSSCLLWSSHWNYWTIGASAANSVQLSFVSGRPDDGFVESGAERQMMVGVLEEGPVLQHGFHTRVELPYDVLASGFCKLVEAEAPELQCCVHCFSVFAIKS